MNGTPSPIAIIGLAGTFPGASCLDTYWHNLLEAHSSISEVPSHRWPPQYFDPNSNEPERFYTRRGGFIDDYAHFDALRFGVMPRAVDGAEPDQLMSLQVCAEALEDAGYAPRISEEGVRGRSFDRDLTEVVIGRGGYIGPGMNSLNQRVRTTEQILSLVQQKGWLPDDQLQQLKREFLSHIRPFGPDTAIGLVPNLCASRVADRLGLGGAAYTVDAACASALIAVARACESLDRGRANLALAGGVHMVHDLTFWSVFSQLGALSRTQQSRPFHADADGLLMGEGVGAVVLKRLVDAQDDGDRIYAVIRGFGVSSDGGKASLMSPDVQGQVRAMSQAWDGLNLHQVGLIEAHGTGTLIGDQVELTSTRSVFGDEGPPIGIGSVKSNIGHTMPAAGAAGLIKAALSIYHGVKPPTLNVEEPHPLFGGRLYPLTEKEPWNDKERWAGVSAFGFGGINAHLALSQAPTYSPLRPPLSRFNDPQAIIGVAAHSSEALAIRLEALAEQPKMSLIRSQAIGEGSVRAVLLDPDQKSLLEAASLVRNGKVRQGRKGLWLSKGGLLDHCEALDGQESQYSRQLALMFPGIEATFAPRIDDLCAKLGLAVPQLYPPMDLGERGVSVVRLGMALERCFRLFGITPNHICGHSIGEWTGLISAGYFSESSIEPFIQGLDPKELSVPEIVFIAAGAGHTKVETVLKTHLNENLSSIGVYCSHDNCPHQSIFCLPPQYASDALKALNQAQILAQELPFRSGFHAPHFKPYATELTQHMRSLALKEPKYTMWSATTLSPYPPAHNSEAFYDLSGQHLIEPVRFRALIERLYEEGVRVFVQMGVGSLSSFVSDTLRGRPHRVIDAHSERRSGWSQWLQLAGTLFNEGANIDFEHLNSIGIRSTQAMKLDLGAGLVDLGMETDDRHKAEIVMHPTQVFEGLPTRSDELRATKVEKGRPRFVGAHLGDATYPSLLVKMDTHPNMGSKIKYEAKWRLSIDQYPHLEDHCFFRQPPKWPVLEDRFPVVPMTLSIQWVMEVAQQLADEQGQGLRVIGVKNVRAAKWIEIEPAQSVSVIANWRDDDYVNVDIIGHLSALVHLSSTPPVHPNVTWAAQSDEQTPPLKAQAIYTSRWMFHGSAYQGIEDLIGISPTGMRGILRNDGVPGALLDNVGQLFGLWVMLTQSEDRVVMPVRLLDVQFFGPPPPIGDLLPCDVQIESVDRREVKANMTLWHNHKVWAIFTGWSDWRFETSGQLWSLMRYPERTLFAHPLMNQRGVTLTLAERISTAASSREFLVGRCLNKKERTEYRALSVHRQRDWLAGRIAAKDALRQWAWSRGVGSLFPIEIGVDQAVTDRPPQFDVDALPQALQANYALSITHSDGLALAAMLHPERQNGAIGVDLEKVEHRTQEWREVSFSTNELARLASMSKERHDDALTSWWTIKESAAKCASQLGIVAGLGTPQKWQIDAWHMTNEVALYEEVEVLSSGTANVRLLDKERYFKVAWWLFRRHQQTWACSLCLGD